MTSLLLALRAQTASIHQELHVHPFMTQHIMTGLTFESYARFLVAFSGPWAQLDAGREGEPSGIGTLPSLLPDLRSDLQALGHEVAPAQGIGLSRPALLGMAYVLYGSSLGAPILARRMRLQMPDAPMRYLTSEAGTSGWRALVPTLAAQAGEGPDAQAAIHSAIDVFDGVRQRWNGH